MNRRQRKKKSKRQEITVFIRCDKAAQREDYRGSVVLLPAYLHVEQVVRQQGSRRIVIKHESEEPGSV